ncbi:MAG TPA: Ig-like domain-containing protein [Vicinamibacterales bacterium]|nr:Ig-like domain-containing protein [Vicinamibacterales bacterium]
MAVVGMAGCAYHTPTESQPIPVGVRNPSLIVIDFVSGTGTKAGTATITARVLNSLGDALVGESVSFTTDTGSLSPAVAVTDKDGKSATALTASISAHVKATVGSLSTESPIAIQPAPTAGSPAPGIATATM